LDKLNSPLVAKLNDDVQAYIKLQLQYQKLDLAEKGASAAAVMVIAVTVLIVLFFTLIAFMIFLAASLAYFFNSIPLGFGALLGVFVLAIVLIAVFAGFIKRQLFNLFLSVMLDTISQDDDYDDHIGGFDGLNYDEDNDDLSDENHEK
jgi:uncharacterized membrane protein (DUF485 family)